MDRSVLVAAIAALVLVAAGFALKFRSELTGRLPPPVRDFIRGHWHGFKVERDIMIAMPDGVRLAANLYLPRGPESRRGTVLVRLPYGKDTYGDSMELGEYFVRQGFAVVVQDMRGKFRSEGIFTPIFRDDTDGSATLDWIVRQPWSNGKVGTAGCSALGESQWVLASGRHPAHVAAIAEADGGALGVIPGRLDPFGWYEGGIFNLASGFGWFLDSGAKERGHPQPDDVDRAAAVHGLPTVDLVRRYRRDPTDFERFLTAPFDIASWQTSGYVKSSARFAAPFLQVTAWHDQALGQTLALAGLLERNAETEVVRDNHHVIIAPGFHCSHHQIAQIGRSGEMPIAGAAALPYWDWYTQWFRHWLGDGTAKLPDLPAYLLYVTGEDRWVQSDQWPLAATDWQIWRLDSSGHANTAAGDGRLSREAPAAEHSDEFVADPGRPVPTVGGPFCCTGNKALREGSVDQREVEAREDVLVYTSEPLPHGLRVLGPLRAELFVASSARDTDLVVKIVDVAPDGGALNVQEGALRLRYREGWERAALLTPGEVYPVTVDLRAIGHYFRPGHRLRLQVAGSSFPRLERNLNTGGNNYDEKDFVIARNRVFHGPSRLSTLRLPVIDSPQYFRAE